MRLAKNWSIKTKILLPAIGGVSVVGIVLFVYFLYTIYGIQTKNLDESSKQTVNFLANALEYSVISGNVDDVDHLLEWVMVQPEIKSIRVMTQEGELIFKEKKATFPEKYLITYTENIITTPSTSLLSPSDEFSSNKSTNEVRGIGQLVVVISNEQLLDGFYKELFLAGMFFIFVFIFVLSMALLSINATNLSFYKIKQAIRLYKDGNLDARIDLDPNTDIGEIAEQFNNMAKAIQEKDIGLREASSLQNRFISTMSHDLRSPLGVIISNLELTLERDDVPASGKMNLNYCMMASKQLLKLIDDIIGVNKLSKNAETLSLSDFNLIELINQIVLTMQYDSNSKSIHLSFDNSNNNELWVKGDSNKVMRLLNNLISNAIKFTEKGSVQIFLSVSYSEHNNIIVSIEVRDTGIGMHEKDIKNIFKPFKRIENAYTSCIPGSGLGLSIVSEYVKLMKGSINVNSKENLGSVFSIKLPFPLVKEKSQPKLATDNVVIINSNNTEKSILFVDDNIQYRNIIENILSTYNLSICINGMDALDVFKKNRFDLVVLDCHMPLMDGFSVAKQIRILERTLNLPRTPIVALTANAVSESKEQAKLSGMDDYMTKPFSKVDILNKVEHWLNKSKFNSEVQS